MLLRVLRAAGAALTAACARSRGPSLHAGAVHLAGSVRDKLARLRLPSRRLPPLPPARAAADVGGGEAPAERVRARWQLPVSPPAAAPQKRPAWQGPLDAAVPAAAQPALGGGEPGLTAAARVPGSCCCDAELQGPPCHGALGAVTQEGAMPPPPAAWHDEARTPPPPGASAAALKQQRRATQQRAWEGLTLADALSSGSKPAGGGGRRALLLGGGAESEA